VIFWAAATAGSLRAR